ncbi:hypothetical protein P691DRAFT_158735 [Macrolepiota fuliginosa MF-IS2]|uniref:Uncharacterized protein n=1 Tax=Macrolepiota fuliginosa MF-IS2 TaxID=1400762 RepID=A0A9P5XCJ3_9AGAR|nr:hypothetical protein P691DRAFT_158735 [Macrolepiota fuliginosa MF-IS2]
MSLMTLATCVGLALIIRAAIVPVIPSHVDKPYNVFQYLVCESGTCTFRKIFRKLWPSLVPGLILSIFGTQLEFFKCWVCRRPTKPLQQGPDETDATSISS